MSEIEQIKKSIKTIVAEFIFSNIKKGDKIKIGQGEKKVREIHNIQVNDFRLSIDDIISKDAFELKLSGSLYFMVEIQKYDKTTGKMVDTGTAESLPADFYTKGEIQLKYDKAKQEFQLDNEQLVHDIFTFKQSYM